MNRNQLILLKKWLENPRRKPLIVRGARQVGKSTLIRLFAEASNLPLRELNLERMPQLDEQFKSLNPRQVLDGIESLPKMGDVSENTILFLDEIQSTPNALPLLRYFYEDNPNIPVVAAGSLLEFTLKDHSFSMPVGRIQYLHMEPMTFLEFLAALEEQKLYQIINTYQLADQINAIAHNRLLELLRLYFFVGGMPEAVRAYSETRKLSTAQEVHKSIIATYQDDLPKYCGSRDLNRVLSVFNYLATHVGEKIKYSNINSAEQSKTLKKDIDLLSQARIISKVTHTQCSALPLHASTNPRHYKTLFLDIGLMNTISGMTPKLFETSSQEQLLHHGTIAEQFIGQHLLALNAEEINRELLYWIREGRSNNAEIDYVTQMDGEIIPIEVKAGKSGSLRSLHQFMAEKSAKYAIRFNSNRPAIETISTHAVINKKRTGVTYPLISLPLYLIERIKELSFENL